MKSNYEILHFPRKYRTQPLSFVLYLFIFKESGDIATLGAEGADLSAKMVVAVGRDPKNVVICCQLVQQNNQDEPLSTFKLAKPIWGRLDLFT